MAANAIASWAPPQPSLTRIGAKRSSSVASPPPPPPRSLLRRNPSLLFPPCSQFSAQPVKLRHPKRWNGFAGAVACLPPAAPRRSPAASAKLYVSGLSFRTTEEGLRNAFEKFGQLVDVNLVMDRVANRPRGFAFLRYATEEESKAAIEGMHGKAEKEYTSCQIEPMMVRCLTASGSQPLPVGFVAIHELVLQRRLS